MRSCPVVQQLHGRLDAAGEELIGQVAVCERPGELQRAEHQSEERERVGSSRLGVCRVETRRDVVDDAHQFVGEDLFGGGGAAGDLVEQRSRRAAVGVLVAVLRGQVGADERFESRPIRGLGVEALALGAQLVGEHVRDEIFLGREVGVEGAVGQAGVGHTGETTPGTAATMVWFPSPQLTSYPYVSSVPAGSVHEKPRVTVLPLTQAVPLLPVSDVIVTVGLTFDTVMVISSVSERLGSPLSVTTTLIRKEPSSAGVQVNAPVDGSIVAPEGTVQLVTEMQSVVPSARLKVRVLAGRSASVALA